MSARRASLHLRKESAEGVCERSLRKSAARSHAPPPTWELLRATPVPLTPSALPHPCGEEGGGTPTPREAAGRQAQGSARPLAPLQGRNARALREQGGGAPGAGGGAGSGSARGTLRSTPTSHGPGIPAEWRGRGCPRHVRHLGYGPSPREERSDGRRRCHGAGRAARSPRELVFPGGHVMGWQLLGPGWGWGDEREAGGRRLARCVLRSCAGAFLSQEPAGEGEGRPLRLLLFAMLTQSINSGTKGPTSSELC